jgi:hypothetical protein
LALLVAHLLHVDAWHVVDCSDPCFPALATLTIRTGYGTLVLVLVTGVGEDLLCLEPGPKGNEFVISTLRGNALDRRVLGFNILDLRLGLHPYLQRGVVVASVAGEHMCIEI